MAGRGSLAGLLSYGDANAIVVEMASEVLPVVQDTMVMAGVNGTDPFRIMPVFLKQLKEMGFDGVQNFPTVGLIDGVFRQNLEETGMSYDLEVEMIAAAHELDMLTSPYVFTPEEAVKMAKAGADILVPHCHGGPIAEPQDAQYIFDNTKGIVGFFGASSVERLPTEVAIEGQARKFKELTFRS